MTDTTAAVTRKWNPDPATDYYLPALQKVAERYCEVWPNVRNALLERRRIDEAALVAHFGMPMNDLRAALHFNPTGAREKVALDIARRYKREDVGILGVWLREEAGGGLGRFGVWFTTGEVPIFSPADILAFAARIDAEQPERERKAYEAEHAVPLLPFVESNAIDDALRAIPPAFIERDLKGGWLYASALSLPQQRATREMMPPDVGTAFDHLEWTLNDARSSAEGDVFEHEPLRHAYANFARVFYPWWVDETAKSLPDAEPLADFTSFYANRAIATTSSAAPMFDANVAISKPRWINDPGQPPYHVGKFSKLRFFESLTVVENEAWRDVETAICHEAMIAKWLTAYRAGTLLRDDFVLLTLNEILDLRGTAKQKGGGYRTDDRTDIYRRIQGIRTVDVAGRYSNPEGVDFGDIKGHLVEVLAWWPPHLRTDPPATGTPPAILFRPGFGITPVYADVAYMTDYFTALARLDVARSAAQRMAYQIGRYLIYQWRIRETRQSFLQPFKIETLLDGAGIEQEANATKFERFFNYVQGSPKVVEDTVPSKGGALDVLKSIGILTAWEYAPADFTERLEVADPNGGASRRMPGWFKTWITQGKVVLHPPESVIEHGRQRAAARAEQMRQNALAGMRRNALALPGKKKGKRAAK